MSGPPLWWRIRRLLGPNPASDVDEELRHHLEQRAEELVARGMDPEAARAEAMRRFGDLDRVRREVMNIDLSVARRNRFAMTSAEVWQDVRFAFRTMRRIPGFAMAAVGTLALGIGANLAVFSTVNSVLLRPLPFGDPERLMMLWESNPEKGWERGTVAASNMLDWRERVGSFADVAAYASFEERMTLSGLEADPQAVTAGLATGNFFRVLGVEPEIGRTLRWEETWTGTEPVALLSHAAWVRYLGADATAVGQAVALDGESYRVAGVLPPEFRLPGTAAEVWIPVGWNPEARSDPSFRRAHWLRAVARLKPGVTVEEAQAELEAVAHQLEIDYPETNRLMGAGLTSLHDFLLGDTSSTLLIVLAAVGILLLLACANVGNLLLVKALSRQREMAIRSALGAGRARLLRQLCSESVVLAVLGGVGGLALAWIILRILETSRFAPPLLGDEGLLIDTRFVVYLLGLSLVSGLVFGTFPALLASGRSWVCSLKDRGKASGQGLAARRASQILVAGEVALSVLLVAGAVLLTRTFLELRGVDTGFDDQNVLTASVALPPARYGADSEMAAAFQRLRQAIGSVPGVESVAAVRQLPLTRPSWSSDFVIDGRAPDEYGVEVLHREVTPGYFKTLRVPLLKGRSFSEADREDAQPVIVINEALVERHFAGEDPIGARVAFTRSPSPDTEWWTVVGIVGNERQGNPAEEPRMEIFAPVAQSATSGMSFVVRSELDPAGLAASIRERVRQVDPELVLDEVRTLSAIRSAATAREEFLAFLFASFAGFALVLAMVGVYGVMAESVRTRDREIGIRLALGAARFEVLAHLARYSLPLLAVGTAAGLIASALLTEGLSSLLYGVAPRDPATLAAAAGVLLLAGLTAAAVPAIRAVQSDPAAILRQD